MSNIHPWLIFPYWRPNNACYYDRTVLFHLRSYFILVAVALVTDGEWRNSSVRINSSDMEPCLLITDLCFLSCLKLLNITIDILKWFHKIQWWKEKLNYAKSIWNTLAFTAQLNESRYFTEQQCIDASNVQNVYDL